MARASKSAKARRYKGTKNEVSHIREDLESLRGNVIALTRTLGDEVSDTARDQWQHAKDAGRDAAARVEENVRHHPAQSIMVAFCSGLVLSLLMRRR